MNNLSIFIKLKGDSNLNPNPIEFYDIFKHRHEVDTIIFLFDFNSYLVNIEEGYFCINGGRKVQMSNCNNFENRTLVYAKKHSKEVDIGSEEEVRPILINYLIGIGGELNGEPEIVAIQFTEDGTVWSWRNKR
jgi:hypothetical protein